MISNQSQHWSWASVLGDGVETPRFWAGGRWLGRRLGRGGSWTGREILLYLIMYTKQFIQDILAMFCYSYYIKTFS